jgi:hypothetical protein
MIGASPPAEEPAMMFHPETPATDRRTVWHGDAEDSGRGHDAACCEALAQVYEGCCGVGPMSDTLAILQALDPRALDAPARPGLAARLLAHLRHPA